MQEVEAFRLPPRTLKHRTDGFLALHDIISFNLFDFPFLFFHLDASGRRQGN